MKQLRAQIEATTSNDDKERLQGRLAKLSGGVAVINVGAATKTKMKEKKDRVEDVLNTTRAAVEEGTGSFGFNAETGIYEDLMQAGIVDPTKLSRLALQHAASAPGLFMTTEAVIAEKPKKKEICGT